MWKNAKTQNTALFTPDSLASCSTQCRRTEAAQTSFLWWMKKIWMHAILMQTTLQKHTRLSPCEIIRPQLTYVKAKVNERLLTEVEKSADDKERKTKPRCRRQRKRTGCPKTRESLQETWKQRSGCSSYRSKDTVVHKLLAATVIFV